MDDYSWHTCRLHIGWAGWIYSSNHNRCNDGIPVVDPIRYANQPQYFQAFPPAQRYFCPELAVVRTENHRYRIRHHGRHRDRTRTDHQRSDGRYDDEQPRSDTCDIAPSCRFPDAPSDELRVD